MSACASLASLALSVVAAVDAADTPQLAQVKELSRLSLEELANVEVTSVSKAVQPLSIAPAAIYVITRDEILRSGVTSIPEALRLAPNLQVAQLGSSSYAITARGFGDKREVQTQANKLLILIDGRSVYSPLFSGVFYDALDLLMDDVDRIEVISGPGATLWGANAMNGVINIITRQARETEGTLVRVGAGNQEWGANLRYGSGLGSNGSYRLYGKAFERDSLQRTDGSSAQDLWSRVQGGGRADWAWKDDTLTLQGDLYRADQSILGSPDFSIQGANALGRWRRTTDRSQWMVQLYYDRTEREAPIEGAAYELDTYDLELQHSFALGSAHRIVWGAGKRINSYRIANVGQLQFHPPHRSLNLSNVFVQDVISLRRALHLTVGLKLEDNPYSGWTALPDLRLSWSKKETMLLWAAASRAIRSPTPFDADVAEFLGTTLFLAGNPQFRSEEVRAVEIGFRGQPHDRLSFSASAFYNVYDNLRTVELSPVTFLPLLWGNRMKGEGYGVEGWANLQLAPWWRLSPGLRTLSKDLRFKPGASGLLGVEQSGNDPKIQASLKSSMDLNDEVMFDAFLRHFGELEDPRQKPYYELSARIAWNVSPRWQLSFSGFNLLHKRHLEYPAPIGAYVSRSFIAEARWRY